MNFNFPLILMILVFSGIAIILLDKFWLSAKRTENQWLSALVENARSLTPILAIVFFIRSFLFEPFQIPSVAHGKNITDRRFHLVNKFTYGIRMPVWRNKLISNNDPERGDVMVFFPPHKDQYYIKRVVGIPGDLVEYSNKILKLMGRFKSKSQCL